MIDHRRWNIEQDGDDLLICFGHHEKPEACSYVRYVPATKLTDLHLEQRPSTEGSSGTAQRE